MIHMVIGLQRILINSLRFKGPIEIVVLSQPLPRVSSKRLQIGADDWFKSRSDTFIRCDIDSRNCCLIGSKANWHVHDMTRIEFGLRIARVSAD